MRYFLLILAVACQPKPKFQIPVWMPYEETQEVSKTQENESPQMRFRLIQSRIQNKNDIWKKVQGQIEDFSEEKYQRLKPLILEQNIPTLQNTILKGKLTYEELVKWYLFRIVKFENDSNRTLHSIIAINPDAVTQARERDQNRTDNIHLIFGMPVLLKDNINTHEMPTTAGAHALQDNRTEDAFIVKKIKEKGGIILGKLNLSEWANFICSGCPNGYSAIGGQTLNPYGRMIHDTGGSSSGSGTSMAVNYATVAVGTETSGSILSPSSSNSVVGLKPTVGLLSRRGIIPISSTLDTPGPITRSVIDNAIFLSVMEGEDTEDEITKGVNRSFNYQLTETDNIYGKKFGVFSTWMNDTTNSEAYQLYRLTVGKIRAFGGEVYEIDPKNPDFSNFLTLLSADMQRDLPIYFEKYTGNRLPVSSIKDIVNYNLEDTLVRRAYNQKLFKGILSDTTTNEQLEKIKTQLEANGKKFFSDAFDTLKVDVVLSINNWHAGAAAVAKYPCLTIPMGFMENGRPMGLTIIARPFEEEKLLQIGYSFEKATQSRKPPEGY